MSEFKQDMKKATQFFLYNKSKIEGKLNCEITSVEIIDTNLAKILDTECGIDYITKKRKGGVFGISARVNFLENMHETVTIRVSRGKGDKYRTKGIEFQKGLDAYKKEGVLPLIAYYGLQMDASKYDAKSDIKRLILYNRKQLFLYAEKNFKDIKDTKLKEVKEDGNTYLEFKYADFENIGIEHKIIDFYSKC